MRLSLGPIYNTTAIIAAANHPEIRLFSVPQLASPSPVATVNATWVQTTPATIPQFSAVCYLTALEWQRLVADPAVGGGRRPMGLILSAVGSTDVQSWMSAEAREAARTGCWAGPGGTPPAELPPSESHCSPDAPASSLWNGMVAPLVPYGVGTVLWDQGENNAHYCTSRQYNCLFATMIASWRATWGYSAGDLPVGFVQLGSYALRGANNSHIRFAQSETLPAGRNCYDNQTAADGISPAPNTAMAVTYDLGSPEPGRPNGTWWIHCRNKTAVGRRLAAAVHQLVHRTASAAPPQQWSGPVVAATRLVLDVAQRPTVQLQMRRADGLRLRPAQGCVSCCNQTGLAPAWTAAHGSLFEVANRRGMWLPAVGKVTGETAQGPVVTVRPTSAVTGAWVSAVRYAAQDVVQCALYNEARFPGVPFELPVPYSAPAAGPCSGTP